MSDYQILDMTKIFEWRPNTGYDQELRYLSDYQILDMDQELRYLSDYQILDRYLRPRVWEILLDMSDYQILDRTKSWLPNTRYVEIFVWLPNTRYDQELRYLSDYQILDMTKSWDIWVTTKS